MRAELARLELPEFGLPTVEPEIPPVLYRQRLAALYARAAEAGYDVFVVYGDREHFANLTYLTGYDPRFEEALLILNIREQNRQKPILLVGNEGIGYVNISPIRSELDVTLFQSFSLLGQDRSSSPKLRSILQSAGVSAGIQVGCAGWKHFNTLETENPYIWLEIPSYIVDTLRELTGGAASVGNANALLMDSSDGLRSINEIEQLARFEFASTYSSQAVRNVLFGLKPGMTEFEAVGLMNLPGLPYNCHLMLGAGERAFLGMISPTQRPIQRGDAFTTACGLWGSLNSRAGFVVESASQLPSGIQDYVEKLVGPYFEAIAAWYSHIGIGVAGGELYKIIHDRIGDSFFGVGLNPGHLIHLDEWVNSPIYTGSTEELKSGMALQVDVIPATGTPYYTSNIEDGIALADTKLRVAFAAQYPEAWARIQMRRAYMQDQLGITLKPEVLPFSNLAAHLPPFLLNPETAMRVL